MGRAEQSKLQEDARRLFVHGTSIADIAGALGKSEQTVYRWKAGDKECGIIWEDLRGEARQKSPVAALAILVEMRETLLHAGTEEQSIGGLADALWKIQRVIDSVRKELGDTSTDLEAIRKYTEWCVLNVPESDMDVVRRSVGGFLSHLKEEGGG